MMRFSLSLVVLFVASIFPLSGSFAGDALFAKTKQLYESKRYSEAVTSGTLLLNKIDSLVDVQQYGVIGNSYFSDPLVVTMSAFPAYWPVLPIEICGLIVDSNMAKKLSAGTALYKNKTYTKVDKYLNKRQQADLFMVLGLSHYKLKNYEAAIVYLARAVSIFDTFRMTISREDRRVSYINRYFEIVEALVVSLYMTAQYEKCFYYIENYKSRVLSESLFSIPFRKFKQINRKSKIVQAESEALLMKPTFHECDLNSLRSRGISVIEDTPRSVDLYFYHKNFLPSNVTVKDVPSSEKDAYLTYFISDEGVLSLLVYKGNILHQSFHRISRNDLGKLVKEHMSSAFSENKFDTKSSVVLYSMLVGPFMPYLNESHVDNLIISPHDELTNFSFAALSDGGHYLVEQYSIRYVYSLNTWSSLLDRDNEFAKNVQAHGKVLALVIGNPENLSCSPLPAAEKEACDVESIFRRNGVKTILLLGSTANEDNVKKSLKNSMFVHFAGHSFFDTSHADNSMLCLSPGPGDDGWLHSDELLDSSSGLHALCVLSSCDSGRTLNQTGSEPYGFIRNLLLAGSQRIVSTLWEINDTASERIMETFYDNVFNKGMSCEGALRSAQIEELRSKNRSWMAFKLDGLGGCLNQWRDE